MSTTVPIKKGRLQKQTVPLKKGQRGIAEFPSIAVANASLPQQIDDFDSLKAQLLADVAGCAVRETFLENKQYIASCR